MHHASGAIKAETDRGPAPLSKYLPTSATMSIASRTAIVLMSDSCPILGMPKMNYTRRGVSNCNLFRGRNKMIDRYRMHRFILASFSSISVLYFIQLQTKTKIAPTTAPTIAPTTANAPKDFLCLLGSLKNDSMIVKEWI